MATLERIYIWPSDNMPLFSEVKITAAPFVSYCASLH